MPCRDETEILRREVERLNKENRELQIENEELREATPGFLGGIVERFKARQIERSQYSHDKQAAFEVNVGEILERRKREREWVKRKLGQKYITQEEHDKRVKRAPKMKF